MSILSHLESYFANSLILTTNENLLMSNLARTFSYHPTSLEAFLLEADLLFDEFPRRIRQCIQEFQLHGNESGFLLIRGLPQDTVLPPTPSSIHKPSEKISAVSELWLSSFGSAFGYLFSYFQERQGRIFHDIVPTKQGIYTQSSESSEVLLDFHTEAAFHPFLPDFVLLYCIRPDLEQKASTIVASIRNIMTDLTDWDIQLLYKSEFYIGIDASFGGKEHYNGFERCISILYGNLQDPFFRYDSDLMHAVTIDSDMVLAKINKLVKKNANHVILQSGDLLIIDNRRTVHGRSPFLPRFDGTDRWLQRVYVTRDLNASSVDRIVGERIIRTNFLVQGAR